MSCIKWFVFLGFVVMLAACGNDDLVVESSFDSSVDDIEEMSSSSVKVKSSSSSKGNSSAKENVSSSSAHEPDSLAADSVPAMIIEDKAIYGVAQKGPFLAGTKVKIYELDAKTFAQTGKYFEGKVQSDKDGSFVVPGVTLSSPYALVEVTGSFRNEVTNQFSSNNVTMNALVDLSDRDTVNVNVLTHMESKRVVYLIESGYSFSSAKIRAGNEVFYAFNIFDIDATFENSEDLNIFNNADESAALLAVSVLALCYGGESKLAEFLNDFSADIEKDGEMDDLVARAKVADAAQDKYFKGELSTIYENIVDWNIGSVPNKQVYINYIADFWSTAYGYSPCSGGKSSTKGPLSNRYSSLFGSGVRFSCAGGIWIKELSGSSNQVCAAENEGLVASTGKNKWISCEKGVVLNLSKDEVDQRGWGKGIDGEFRKGNETEDLYMYDEFLDEWLFVDDDDNVLMLNGCTFKRRGEISKSPKDGAYYYCDSCTSCVPWYNDGVEPTLELGWRKAVDVDFVRRDEKCEAGDVGRIIERADSVTGSFYCTVNGWTNLKDWSYDVPKEFRFNPDIDYGTMTDDRDGKTYKTVKIGEQVWMAENLNYAGPNDDISRCYEDMPATCEAGGRIYSLSVADTVCPSGWHLPKKEEFEILLTTVGGIDNAGNALKSISGWTNNYSGSDAYGFSALPTGGALIESHRGPFFSYSGYNAYFFSSDGYVFSIHLWAGTSISGKGGAVNDPNEALLPVRCLKDAE